jgi:hypothetical protein
MQKKKGKKKKNNSKSLKIYNQKYLKKGRDPLTMDHLDKLEDRYSNKY